MERSGWTGQVDSNATLFLFLFLKVKQLLTGGGTSKKNKPTTSSSSSVLTSGGGSNTLKSDKLIRERRPPMDSELSRSRFSESRTEEFIEPQVSRRRIRYVAYLSGSRETSFCWRSPN